MIRAAVKDTGCRAMLAAAVLGAISGGLGGLGGLRGLASAHWSLPVAGARTPTRPGGQPTIGQAARTPLSPLLLEVAPREGGAASPPLTTDQKRRAAASFLSALIILLLMFLAFVAAMIVLRNRLLPRRRPRREKPTDSSDLWSLAGKIAKTPPAGEERPPGEDDERRQAD